MGAANSLSPNTDNFSIISSSDKKHRSANVNKEPEEQQNPAGLSKSEIVFENPTYSTPVGPVRSDNDN